MEWEVDEKIPRFEDRFEFKVWLGSEVRKARRVNNQSMYLTPGILIYTDCNHPLQNIVVDESQIKAWKIDDVAL